MFGYDWEFIGVIITISALAFGAVWYVIKQLWIFRAQALASKQKEAVDAAVKELLKPILSRVSVLESDVKNTALANVQMSQTFNGQLNKILLTFAGRDNV